MDIKFRTDYFKCCTSWLFSSLARLDGLAATAAVLDIPEITHFIYYGKPSSISQLIKGKSRGLQKLLKCFYETATSVSSLLVLAGVPPVIFVFYSKNLLAAVLLLLVL